MLPTILDSHENCTEHNFILQEKGFLPCFFQLFVLQIVLQIGFFACNFLGVQELEKITWFHFACCSRYVIVCTIIFFCRSRYIWQMVEQTKKCAAPAAFVSLIFVKFVVQFFCGVNCAYCYRQHLHINTYQHLSAYFNIYIYIYINIYQHISAHINTYQHLSTYINTNQHISTRINMYQHIATHINIYHSKIYQHILTHINT